MSTNPTALIIDDEPDIRELVAMSLDRIGLDTHTAANLSEARNLLATYQFDVCLTDMKLPDGDGVEFVKYLQEAQPELPVAVVTAHGNMGAAVEAMKNGAFDFVSKPVDIKLLRKLVLQAIDTRKLNAEQIVTLPMDDLEKHNTPATHLTDDLSQGQYFKPNAGQAHSVQSPDDSLPPQAQQTAPLAARINLTSTRLDLPAEGQSSLTDLSGRIKDNPSATSKIGEGKLIGRSDSMNALRLLIAKVSRTNAPVWITGESGTGKELIARLVHENSSRAERPFVAINCGAIPSELMESEMFGHKKGSFTGAQADHDGLFKRAEGGTLFLDEVAELPLQMQVKLLRAIQERAIRPVGCADEINTDVRILSASHKDLNAEVSHGTFRHDLYYRLNVISIEAPSLRERQEDVPDISRHILKNIAANEGNRVTATLSPAAETCLMSYRFPGNVRELENILERAVALNEGGAIEAHDLNVDIKNEQNTDEFEISHLNNVPAANDSHANERKMIVDALQNTQWNRKEAARVLGMSYRQIRYRIQQYGIGGSSSKP